MAKLGKVCALALLACPLLCGQSVLSLGSTTSAPGSTATLTLTLTSTGTPPSGVQWFLTYPPRSVTSIRVVASSVLTATGKSLNCANTTGGYMCLAAGTNATPIGNGVAATVSVTLAATVLGSISIGITGTNAVSSMGISLGASATGGTITALATAGTAVFQKTDMTTGGTWSGSYGGDGGYVIGDIATIPPYVTITPVGNSMWVWANPTTDMRALQKQLSPSSRVAACWFSGSSFSVDLNFNDQKTHQVAFYMVDFYSSSRNERIDILDFSSYAVLDTRNVSSFYFGQYLVWNLSGHVVVRFTNLNSTSNVVVSGLFFR